jgi:hypothetical protein
VIQIAQGTTLDRKSWEIISQGLSAGHGPIEYHSATAALGIQMLQEQPCHATRSHHGHLFLVKGHQFIEASGLAQLQLGQFDSRRTDGNGSRT